MVIKDSIPNNVKDSTMDLDIDTLYRLVDENYEFIMQDEDMKKIIEKNGLRKKIYAANPQQSEKVVNSKIITIVYWMLLDSFGLKI